MSNEQKLRDAIKRLLKAHRITVQAPPKTITEAENQLREIENAVKYAEEALATTEPAVNQQLTTEPFDEREVFEKVFPTPSHCQRCGDGYAATSYNAWEAHNHIERWKGWQARAAMAKGANQ